ncbi:MAG: putative secreted protein [Polyangiaceae bacterium]|jgi:hypothetical protein|nr:putative secreted protein [Polyangiaceae bacterium]
MSKTLAYCLGTAALSIGCAGQPAAPFDQLKTANLTAYRLQNNEPASVLPTAAAPGAAPVIPGLDPNLQNSITAGVQALQKLIPPGLQIPGLQIPGVTGAPGAAPIADTTPRFQTYRILAQQQVLDADLKESLGKLLGDKDNFDNQFARCPASGFFPEFGLSFASAVGAQSNDLLVSLACNQVVSRTFSWPYPATGMKVGTHSDLNEILVKIFPQGT